MTTSAEGSAHNATIRTVSRSRPMRERIDALVVLCRQQMTVDPDGGLTDCDTLWPSLVLDVLGIAYGPGSELATRPNDDKE